MNDKISKQKMYTDFSIRLDRLEYKLDKLLDLMENPKSIVNNMTIEQWNNSLADVLTERPQWPNESYIDYMKRIGELNTAQSDEEAFREECK